VIRLVAGDWTATLAPALGGAVLDLSWRGEPILRPSPPGASEPLETACFPLVPYANRIADGRFSFRGREARLPVLPRFAPHALHGEGWLAPWTVAAHTERTVAMAFEGGGGAWPWAYAAEQVVELTDDGLRIDLSMTNTSGEAAPAGLGLHPYFARTDDMTLRLQAETVWVPDHREIAERAAPASEVVDWSDGVALPGAPMVDHCYGGWRGPARLETRARGVEMRASDNARWVQVYAPPGETFVCAEPVTHRPDAVNAPAGELSGLAVLPPGGRLSMWMTIGLAG
jgi:aldose 1-epimerase